MPGKMLGRVGDSPLLGSGGYANLTGGCSSTGHGESILRALVCRQVRTSESLIFFKLDAYLF